MKNLRIESKVVYVIIFIIFSIQTILISHRNTFSPKLIFNFYKENIGLEKGIKNNLILNILELIEKNNLTSFRLESKFMNSRNKINNTYLYYCE